MKKILILHLVLFCSIIRTHSQLITNLIVNPNPPARFTEWLFKTGSATLIISNNSQQPRTVKLHTEIRSPDGSIVAVTNNDRVRIVSINPGNSVLQANDLLPLNAIDFVNPAAANSFAKTGKIQQGLYQFCVRLDSAFFPVPVTALQCRNMNLTGIQLPVLFSPANDEILNKNQAQTAITFRWSNVLRSGIDIPIYQIEVYEVLPDQQPIQALRSNIPLLNTSVRGTTQFIWRPQLLFNDSILHKFIWTIKTTDAKGELLSVTDGNTEGRSEPKIFSVGNLPSLRIKNNIIKH